MYRQFLPLSLERIFRTSAFRLKVFSRRRHSHRAALESFMTYIPATRRNAPVSSTSTSTPILCVTALLLICSKLAPTSARPSHGMMSRKESGRLGDHVWLTGTLEVIVANRLFAPVIGKKATDEAVLFPLLQLGVLSGDGAGRCTCRRLLIIRISWRDRNDQSLLRACSVVQRAESCCVVRDPPWASGISRQAPRVY
jgi:hypothetical protein